MSCQPISIARFLDVSESGPDYDESVRIPWPELPSRLSELPDRDIPIQVIESSWSANAVDWLRSRGRKAESVSRRPSLAIVMPRRLWCPNGFVEAWVKDLEPTTAIDAGCGAGREAVYLASMGWEVQAFDHLPDAIERAVDLERHALPKPAVEWTVATHESFVPSKLSSVVICAYAWSPIVGHQAASWLAQGGVLLGETFTPEHRATFGKPGVHQVLSAADIPNFADYRVLHVDEGLRPNGRHTVRFALQLL